MSQAEDQETLELIDNPLYKLGIATYSYFTF